MKAIIIAAGSATRFGEKTKNLPKSLLDVNGQTILERQVLLFKRNGIDEIIVITGPNSEKFNVKNVEYVQDLHYDYHDILGSLMCAIESISGYVLIVYSDILFDNMVLNEILVSKADICIAADLNWEKSYVGRTMHPKSEAENILILDGKILQIKKNITSYKKGQILAEFLGLIKLSPIGSEIFVNKIRRLKESHIGTFHDVPSLQRAYLTDMLQELIDSKINITPILITGKWCEIDTTQDLERAKKMFL